MGEEAKGAVRMRGKIKRKQECTHLQMGLRISMGDETC